MIDPAFKLLLDEKELAVLGELVVILSQVEEVQVRTVARLRGLDRPSANKLMSSPKVADISAIWSKTIRDNTVDADVRMLVDHALAEIGPVFSARNEFVHGWFQETRIGDLWNGMFGNAWDDSCGGALAVETRRVKSPTPRPVEDLAALRDQAALLSCVVAHIEHLLAGNAPTTSPWLGRIAPILPQNP